MMLSLLPAASCSSDTSPMSIHFHPLSFKGRSFGPKNPYAAQSCSR